MRATRPLVLGTALVLGAIVACQNAPGERTVGLRLPDDADAPVLDGWVEAKRPLDSLLIVDSTKLNMCGRGLAKIDESTIIETTLDRRLTVAEVRVGDRVAVWPDGPILESCPGQFKARLLVVHR